MGTNPDELFTVSVSVRFPLTFIKELDAMCKNRPFKLPEVDKVYPDRSEAIKSLCGIGMFVERNKGTIKDPQFVETLNQRIKDESIYDWLEGLSETQKIGLRDLVNMSLERKQTKII